MAKKTISDIGALVAAVDTLTDLKAKVEAQEALVVALKEQMYEKMTATKTDKIVTEGYEVKPQLDYRSNLTTILQGINGEDDKSEAVLDLLDEMGQDGLMTNAIIVKVQAGKDPLNKRIFAKIQAIPEVKTLTVAPQLRGEIHWQTAAKFLRESLESAEISDDVKERIKALFNPFIKKTVSIKKAK